MTGRLLGGLLTLFLMPGCDANAPLPDGDGDETSETGEIEGEDGTEDSVDAETSTEEPEPSDSETDESESPDESDESDEESTETESGSEDETSSTGEDEETELSECFVECLDHPVFKSEELACLAQQINTCGGYECVWAVKARFYDRFAKCVAFCSEDFDPEKYEITTNCYRAARDECRCPQSCERVSCEWSCEFLDDCVRPDIVEL